MRVEPSGEEAPLAATPAPGLDTLHNEAAPSSASSGAEAVPPAPVCRICLEPGDLEGGKALEEPCSCKGSSSWAHRECVQRWIDERDRGRQDAMACEICKAPYKAHYRPPPPRAPPRARPDNRMQVVVQGRDVFVVVADPESGLPTRHLVPPEAMDEEGDYEEEERMNPTTACVASLFLFILLSMLLSHLFAALPTDGPAPGGGVPASEPPETDAQFQDVSATLLMLWMMMRLLVMVAPTAVLARMVRARAAQGRHEVQLQEVRAPV